MARKPWSFKEDRRLMELVKSSTSLEDAAKQLGRSPGAIKRMVLRLGLSLKSVPFGTAYAVWTGIGATGSILVGMLVYSEPTDPVRVLCLTLIVAGMVGLKLNSPM